MKKKIVLKYKKHKHGGTSTSHRLITICPPPLLEKDKDKTNNTQKMKCSVWFNVKLLCLVVFTHLNDFIFAFDVFFFRN